MSNRLLASIGLVLVLGLIDGSDALNCTSRNYTTPGYHPPGFCATDNYCYYVNYTKAGDTTVYTYEGCASDSVFTIPGTGPYRFPTNNCLKVQTNQTSLPTYIVWASFCNTKDNCTYKLENVVCSGSLASPYLALFMLIVGLVIKNFL